MKRIGNISGAEQWLEQPFENFVHFIAIAMKCSYSVYRNPGDKLKAVFTFLKP